ncbi:hypothetical protein AgCh_013493 [Apium graveolens]
MDRYQFAEFPWQSASFMKPEKLHEAHLLFPLVPLLLLRTLIVNVEEFVSKMKKNLDRTEGRVSELPVTKGAATKTRSKLSTPILKPSLSIYSVSSESMKSPKTVNENEMSSGSSIKPLLFYSKELFKRSRAFEPSKTESSKAPFLASTVTSPPTKKIKATPSNTGTSSQFTPLASQAYSVGSNHLILQSVLVAHEVYEHESKILKDIEIEHKGCASKIQIVEEQAKQNLKAKDDVHKDLKDFATKVQSLEKDMYEEAEKVVHQQIMRTRVDMMLEYHRGEWSSLYVLETVKIYSEAFSDDAFPLDEFNSPGDGDTEIKSLKDNNPDDE